MLMGMWAQMLKGALISASLVIEEGANRCVVLNNQNHGLKEWTCEGLVRVKTMTILYLLLSMALVFVERG